MANKVTAKDVAREAGVSVATVSYVLNDRTDQKISPETKKKVIQIANLLNYVPSYAAKSLATGRNNAIGISYMLSSSQTRNAELMAFANLLIERFNRMKYDVTYVPAHKHEENAPVNRNIDAIIAIDLTQEDFRIMADDYLVPVICVDMLVNDDLFYQVYEDIPFLAQKARMELGSPKKCYFIYDTYENGAYDNFILNGDASIFPLKSREMTPAMIDNIAGNKVIICGAYLALSLLPFIKREDVCVILSEKERYLLPEDVKTLVNNDEKKANLTMNLVMNAMNHNFEINHDHRIR